MNEAELIERIKKGEDIHTEFKEVLLDKNKILKEIVGFANTDGGQLIFGVNDASEIPGIENIDESMRIIDDLAYQRCEPPVTVVQETVNINKKTILVVNNPQRQPAPLQNLWRPILYPFLESIPTGVQGRTPASFPVR